MFGQNEVIGRKYFKDAEKLLVTSVFRTLQGEGPFAGRPAVFVRLTHCNLTCSFCFVGTTWVSMAEAPKKQICDIKVGEGVVAYDEHTQQFVTSTVTRKYESYTDEIVCVRTNGTGNPSDKIYCTPEHPFLVKGKGWVAAGDLKFGDILLHLTPSDTMRLANPIHKPGVKDRVLKAVRSPESRERASVCMRKTMTNPVVKANLRARMRSNNPMKNPEVALKGFLHRKDRGKLTSAERNFIRATEGLPIEFVGDGSLVLGYKVPDFKVTGQKKVIEVWDRTSNHAGYRSAEWRKNRKAIFAAEGYKTLFVPMPISGVRNGAYAAIRKEVAEFINNGDTVQSVTRITKGSKAWVRLAGSAYASCKVYNLEVANQHTYIANGKIVHNCDTNFSHGDWISRSDLTAKIFDLLGDHDPGNYVLVVTGGEPMLQEALSSFLLVSCLHFDKVQIESNGLHLIDISNGVYLVVSPKCAEAKGKATHYLQPPQRVLDRANCLKFVVTARGDSPYHDVPDWALKWRDKRKLPIYVSPMAEYLKVPDLNSYAGGNLASRSYAERVSFWESNVLDKDMVRLNHEYAARYALDHGLYLSIQMQLFASLP